MKYIPIYIQLVSSCIFSFRIVYIQFKPLIDEFGVVYFIYRDWRLRTMTTNEKRVAEREALRSVIQQWNANRLDLFELSEPDEASERSVHSILCVDLIETMHAHCFWIHSLNLSS